MLILDFLLFIIITVCIVYCWMLNRRIQDLQNSRVEFARMIKELNVSIVKAQTSVNELSELSVVTATQLKTAIDEAKSASNQLTEINNQSNNLIVAVKQAQRNLEVSSNMLKNTTTSQSTREVEREEPEEEFRENATMQEAKYTNSLKNFLTNMVTKKLESNSNLSYYDTLKKVNTKK